MNTNTLQKLSIIFGIVALALSIYVAVTKPATGQAVGAIIKR